MFIDLARAIILYVLVLVISIVLTPTLVTVIYHSPVDGQGLLLMKFIMLMIADVWLFLIATKYAFRYITSSK